MSKITRDDLLVSKRVTHLTNNVTSDILSQAIGGNNPPRRIRGVGQYVTPSKYFHTAREKRKKKVSKEEDYAEERARMTARILELEAKLMNHKRVGDENKDVCASTGTLTKVKNETSCRLAIRTKDNVVSAGTIFDYDMDNDNMKVSMDMVADGNCFVPVPIREGMTMLSREVGSQLLWSHHLVIPLDEKPISTQCIDAFMFHLYKVMEEKGTLGSYKFADVGSVSVGISKEDRAQALNSRLLGTEYRQILMFPYNSGCHRLHKGHRISDDPLRNRINNDVSNVVCMAFDISRRKKPVWRIIKCSKQGGIVESEYYVMHDIIFEVFVEGRREEGGGKSIFRCINDLGGGWGGTGDDIRPSQTTFTYKLWPRHHRDINRLVGATTDDVPSPDVHNRLSRSRSPRMAAPTSLHHIGSVFGSEFLLKLYLAGAIGGAGRFGATTQCEHKDWYAFGNPYTSLLFQLKMPTEDFSYLLNTEPESLHSKKQAKEVSNEDVRSEEFLSMNMNTSSYKLPRIVHVSNVIAVIGSGVLSLAWAIAQLGWVAGPRVYTAGGNNVKFCGLAQYGNLVGVSIGYTITASISMVSSNVFTWSGSLTNSDNQELVERLLDLIKPNVQSRSQKEGSESEQFWNLLGGKSEYPSQKISRDAESDPHLFSCTFSRGSLGDPPECVLRSFGY
ncbi:villin-4-like isoform X4 [Cucumis melo var. makuwa]|uniref:Villin-4-like isoform X4 n=1 Tax=Cucumis melo var. makuwa TaxID=1194695 RepID=A0A5A7TUM2_CUCMM|nr:villin-4-like isoform X4 [Cucumis melo var. makuwa]